jgi:hypothetical protein
MTAITIAHEPRPKFTADAALGLSAKLWFLTAVAGQWVLLYYIVSFYGAPTLEGRFQAWSRNPLLLKGYVPGDTAGNLAFAAHVMFAAIVAFGGAVQLVPWIRRRAPVFHRWNGRLFMITVLGAAISGLSMVWIRGASANLIASLAVSLNAALDIAFVALAWRAARERHLADHGRWAMRAYIVANGQFFVRVGIFGWLLAFRGPFGMTDRMDGPADIFFAFGCYLLPLAVLELYRRTRNSAGPRIRYAMAGALFGLTAFMGAGIVGFDMMLRHHRLI